MKLPTCKQEHHQDLRKTYARERHLVGEQLSDGGSERVRATTPASATHRAGQRMSSVDLREGLRGSPAARVDRGGDREIVAGVRAVAERGRGQTRAEPGEPAAGLAGDGLAETLAGGGVAPVWSAIVPARRPGSALSGFRSAAVLRSSAPGRVVLASGRWRRPRAPTGRGIRARTAAASSASDARAARPSRRGSAGRATVARRPARSRQRCSRRRAPSAAAMPRKPSAGPVRAGISQNQSTEPWISHTTSGSSAAPATAASSAGAAPRPGRGGDQRGDQEHREQQEADDPGVGEQAQLEAVRPRGSSAVRRCGT